MPLVNTIEAESSWRCWPCGARRYLGLLRLRPFDTSTADGRSQERYRRITLTACATAMGKATSFATALISVPLTIHYLGQERYGLWMTITSVNAMLSFADLGLGNGLMNSVAAASAHHNRKEMQAAISGAIVSLSAVALALMLVLGLICPWISWGGLFKIQSAQAVKEAGPAVILFVACFAINLPLGLVQRIQMGLQQGFANSMVNTAGNLCGLGGVLVAISQHAGLPTLVLASSGGAVMANCINAIYLFGFKAPWLRPARATLTADSCWKLLRVGGTFSLMNLIGVLGSSSNNILIAQLLGAAMVTEYSVADRLFAISSQIVMTILYPLWPAYAEAYAKRDFDWIRLTLRRTAFLGFSVSAVTAIVLGVFRAPIYSKWIGPNNVPSLSVLLAIGAATTIINAAHPYGIFLFSINSLRFSMVTTIITSILGIALKISAVRWTGVSGIGWATAVTQLSVNTIPIMIFVPGLLRRSINETSSKATAAGHC